MSYSLRVTLFCLNRHVHCKQCHVEYNYVWFKVFVAGVIWVIGSLGSGSLGVRVTLVRVILVMVTGVGVTGGLGHFGECHFGKGHCGTWVPHKTVLGSMGSGLLSSLGSVSQYPRLPQH